MECGICLEKKKKFVSCATCKKEWCGACYDKLKKPLIIWDNRTYYVSDCPYCRRHYLWGSRLLGIDTVEYRLNRSRSCIIS